MNRIEHKHSLKNHLLHTMRHSIFVASIASLPAFAQVSTVASSVNNKVSGFLTIVAGVGVSLFTLAIIMAAYKFAFVENTKLHDLRGLLIGGVLFGAAGAIAYYINSY